jgi:hypothetical protein
VYLQQFKASNWNSEWPQDHFIFLDGRDATFPWPWTVTFTWSNNRWVRAGVYLSYQFHMGHISDAAESTLWWFLLGSNYLWPPVWAGHPRFEPRWVRKFFFPSILAPRPNRPPVQWALGLFPGVKWPGRGINHPHPSSVEVKEKVELYVYSSFGRLWPVTGKLYLYCPFTVWGIP